MNIQSLRVFSSMYGLDITEEEFLTIEQEVNSGKRGIYNAVRKKGYIVYVDHNNKSTIVIRKSKSDIVIPSRILCKTMVTFEPLPDEIYTLHSINRYRAQDWKFVYRADNLEELKDRIIDRFTDRYDKELNEEDIAVQEQAIYWLFNQEYTPITKDTRTNISTILKVFENKNRRTAIIKKKLVYTVSACMGSGSREEESIHHSVLTFTPADAEYNYVDEGREFGEDIWIDDPLTGKVSAEELDIIEKRMSKGFGLLTTKIYSNIQNELRLEILSAKKRSEESEIKRVVETEAEKQFQKGKLIRNGVTFTKEYIAYDDMELKGPRIEEFISYNNIITAENTDFNSIVTTYIDFILNRGYAAGRYGMTSNIVYDIKEDIQLTIGKVNLKVSKQGNNYYVWCPRRNRIKKDELPTVLRMALAYDLESYSKFIENVSSVSLELGKILINGLSFSVKPRQYGNNDCDLAKDSQDIFFNLQVTRVKNKNYVKINDKQFYIKDTPRLLELKKTLNCDYSSRIDPLQRMINIISKSIQDISPKEIGDLIKDGKKMYLQKVKRSKEFIKNAVKLASAKIVEDGYIVKGISGKEYFVSNDLKVWEWEKNNKTRYVCIVDVDSERDEAGVNDCIAKRILALSKDKFIAKEVDTLEV